MRMTPAHPVLPAPFQRWPAPFAHSHLLAPAADHTAAAPPVDPTEGLRPEELRILRARSPSISYQSATGQRLYLKKHLLLGFDERQPILCSLGALEPEDREAAEVAGLACCTPQGVAFCAPVLDSPQWIRVRNLQFVWSFYTPSDGRHRRHCQDILDHVSADGPTSLHEASKVLAYATGLLETFEAVWWTMVAHGILRCDLDAYLTPRTVCTFNEAYRSHCVAEDEYWTEGTDGLFVEEVHEPHELREASELNHEQLRTIERHSQWLTLTRLQNDRLVDVDMRSRMPASYHGVSITSLAGATLEPDFDCPLQRDLVSRLMFDHQVTVEKEPASVYYERPDGGMAILRFDLLIHFQDKPSVYCIVPNPARPHTCFELEAKTAKGTAFATSNNCRFDIFDETRIRTQRLRNIQFLWEHCLAEELDIEHLLYDRIIEAASSLGSGTRAEFLKGHPHAHLDRGDPETFRNAHRLEAAWWTLVFHKVLRCNLDEPLTESTVYSLDAWERERRLQRYATAPNDAGASWFSNVRRQERAMRVKRRLGMGMPI